MYHVAMNRLRSFLVALLALVLAIPTLAPAGAEISSAVVAGDYVPNQIIVGYRNQGNASEMAAIREQVRRDVAAKSFSQVSPLASDTELVELGQGISVGEAMARLRGKAGVRFVEPNYIYTTMATSNDTYFTNGSLWGMYGSGTAPANSFGSNAANAWGRNYIGSKSVVIGVIDEGIQIGHPDLVGNIWSNPFDSANGIDDDKNGYVDDINGWDFVSNNNSVYDGTGDDHGTHVSGTIGGRGGNGSGVAGANWDVTLISAKFLGSNGGTTANAILAVDYLTSLKKKGVNIVATSNSWGGGGFSQGLLDAINRGGDEGILFIVAAGNSSLNIDSSISYPAGYECTRTAAGAARGWDCILSVAAINSSGALSSFSNFGATRVDLGAPGENIWSTLPNGTYGSYSGTSMATPHVSGAAALCKSINPSLSGQAIRNAITSTVVETQSLIGKTATNGRLDIGAMATACAASLSPTYAIASATATPTSKIVATGYAEVDTRTTLTLNLSGTTGSAPTSTLSVDAGRWSVTAGSSTIVSDTVIEKGKSVTVTLLTGASIGTLTLSLQSNSLAGSYTATLNSSSPLSYTVTVGDVPGVVPNLKCIKAPQKGRVNCSWTQPSIGSSSLIRYEYQLRQRNSEWPPSWTSTNLNTNVSLTNLSQGISYDFQVRAVNRFGNGPTNSPWLTFTA
jgi:hypothetical protein